VKRIDVMARVAEQDEIIICKADGRHRQALSLLSKATGRAFLVLERRDEPFTGCRVFTMISRATFIGNTSSGLAGNVDE
jgi:hypothetical protein